MAIVVGGFFGTLTSLAEVEQGEYVITKVYDGDTVWAVKDGERKTVRLAGIDAPELKQEYGRASKEYLSNMILNKHVQLEILNVDRYGRTVATIYFNGENVNRKMVFEGQAWAYRQYSTGLEQFEEHAKICKLGLWANPNPERPSDYRKHK